MIAQSVDGARGEFLQLRATYESSGMPRADAAARIHRERPDLRGRMVSEANGGRVDQSTTLHGAASPGRSTPSSPSPPATVNRDSATLAGCKMLGPASNAFWSAVEANLAAGNPFAFAVEKATNEDTHRNARRLAEETAALARAQSRGGL